VQVAAGQAIGRMGYTGAGIDQRRAHVHVELNIMLSSQFESWHGAGFSTPNHHGVYNGLNLLGVDLQALYAGHAKNPALSVAGWLKASPAAYEVTVPGTASLEIVRRYPWLREGGGGSATSWRVRCNPWGVPLSIQPGQQAVVAPVVTWIKDDPIPHYYSTRGIVSNAGKLTSEGNRFIQLLTGISNSR
jgi:hypothetical protein